MVTVAAGFFLADSDMVNYKESVRVDYLSP